MNNNTGEAKPVNVHVFYLQGAPRFIEERLPFGHKAVPVGKSSGHSFLWIECTYEPTKDQLVKFVFELAQVYQSGNTLSIGENSTWSEYVELYLPTEVRKWFRSAKKFNTTSAVVAYEMLMADLDTRSDSNFRTIESKFAGVCKGCHTKYRQGEQVRWNRVHGCFHLDCFEKTRKPSERNHLVFTEVLVEELRSQLVEAENMIIELRRRCNAAGIGD